MGGAAVLSHSMPKRGPHPGVKLIRRTRKDGCTWYGRYRHPTTGRWIDLNLTEAGMTTERARREWARWQSGQLAANRGAKLMGRAHGITTLAQAVNAYLEDCGARNLRPGTLRHYEATLRSLEGWLANRVKHVEEITPGMLWLYRTAALKQGAAPNTVNSHFSRIHAALQWWRKAELVPLLNSDHINDACKWVQVDRPAPLILTSEDIRAVLDHALRRRDPWAGSVFSVALLLGVRAGELARLSREQFFPGAPPAGELRLGVETKTRRPRVIDLAVSPVALRILKAIPNRGPFLLGGPRAISKGKLWGIQKELQTHGAATWTWQNLRQTCGSWLANAPGIWGAASIYRTAAQLGHTVSVAEKHYLNVVRGISPEARSLEEAMGVAAELKELAERLEASPGMDPTTEQGSVTLPVQGRGRR